MSKIVYVVHAIDTEGPLYESIDATFSRIKEIFGYDFEPSEELLRKLQMGEVDLDGNEETVSEVLSSSRITCHPNWEHIDNMLDDITSREFRHSVEDSFGGGWKYTWFCLDHVGITGINPRRRDLGFHKVQDHFSQYLKRNNDGNDLIQWHYHALSLTNDAHRAGSTYLNSDHIYNILTRKVIERSWFPASFRPGHHTERPDAHFFLEQWIPFDYGNDSVDSDIVRPGLSKARYGNWTRASRSWIPYHPDHDDYQTKGNCRRLIARCLPINERAYQLSMNDVEQAFNEADMHGASLLAVTDHDFRNMRPDVKKVMELLKECASQHKDIKFKYVDSIEGMRGVMKIEDVNEIDLNIDIIQAGNNHRLIVNAKEDVFGPQPFLALKTKDGKYFWQNFDFEGPKQWSYSFDEGNILLERIEEIGIAANSAAGLTEVINLNVVNRKQERHVYNSKNQLMEVGA